MVYSLEWIFLVKSRTQLELSRNLQTLYFIAIGLVLLLNSIFRVVKEFETDDFEKLSESKAPKTLH